MRDTEQRGSTLLRVVRGDITEQDTDAIVNAANKTLLGGGGVDGAIHSRGGPEILADCRRIRAKLHPDGLPTGEAVATTAGRLPARRVIHTVGPVWHGGGSGEAGLLANAYRSSLERALEEGLRSVSFPAISTGVYGFPIVPAARIAIRTVRDHVDRHPGIFDEIRFVVFSDDDLRVYRGALVEGGA